MAYVCANANREHAVEEHWNDDEPTQLMLQAIQAYAALCQAEAMERIADVMEKDSTPLLLALIKHSMTYDSAGLRMS